MAMQPTADLEVGGSIPGRATMSLPMLWLGDRGSNLEAVDCITTRPPHVLQ